MNASVLFLVNLIVTWYLVGLIWTVQVVHYQLFDRVGDSGFPIYEKDHSRLITWIVAPPMLLELGTSGLLVFQSPAGMPTSFFVLGFAAVVMIWLSTFLVQVPCHTRLLSGFNRDVHRRLVRSNWIRTVLWTMRGALLAWLVVSSMASANS